MKQPKIGWVAGLLMIFLFFMMLSSIGQGGETSSTLTSGGQTPQGVLPQQGAETLPLDEQWKLVQFENLAINIDGQLYDKGTFQNQATGETVIARCVTMEIADPNIGDLYTRSGDTFSPVGGKSQTFQTFQMVSTPSPTPTIAVTPTQPPEGILPSTAPEPSIGGFFDKLGKIIMWAAIIIVVLIFAFLIFALGRTFFWW